MKKILTLIFVISLFGCTDWTEDYEEYRQDYRDDNAAEIQAERDAQCARCTDPAFTYSAVDSGFCYSTLAACQDAESGECFSCN